MSPRRPWDHFTNDSSRKTEAYEHEIRSVHADRFKDDGEGNENFIVARLRMKVSHNQVDLTNIAIALIGNTHIFTKSKHATIYPHSH